MSRYLYRVIEPFAYPGTTEVLAPGSEINGEHADELEAMAADADEKKAAQGREYLRRCVRVLDSSGATAQSRAAAPVVAQVAPASPAAPAAKE